MNDEIFKCSRIKLFEGLGIFVSPFFLNISNKCFYLYKVIFWYFAKKVKKSEKVVQKLVTKLPFFNTIHDLYVYCLYQEKRKKNYKFDTDDNLFHGWRLLKGMGINPTQKRFYARGTLRSIRITWLAKIPTLYCDWLRSLK